MTTEARKDDAEKIRMDLLSPWALEQLGQVLTFGAKKYGDNNWRKGLPWSRVQAALLRHLSAWAKGEYRDTESKLPHIAHVMCCAMFLAEYQQLGLGEDDRWQLPAFVECVLCAAKPGSPDLCPECLERRDRFARNVEIAAAFQGRG